MSVFSCTCCLHCLYTCMYSLLECCCWPCISLWQVYHLDSTSLESWSAPCFFPLGHFFWPLIPFAALGALVCSKCFDATCCDLVLYKQKMINWLIDWICVLHHFLRDIFVTHGLHWAISCLFSHCQLFFVNFFFNFRHFKHKPVPASWISNCSELKTWQQITRVIEAVEGGV